MDLKRIRKANDKPLKMEGSYVLYWMQAYRRFDANFAFEYAVHLAKKFQKELIVYEGFRMDYPWSSERIHTFILEGMEDNGERAKELGVNYWSFVETKDNPARGILKKICESAVCVVTDDFPCFIIPEQTANLAKKVNCSVFRVDSNSLVPIGFYGREASAARVLRIWMHKAFQKNWGDFAKEFWTKKDLEDTNRNSKPPFASSSLSDLDLSKMKFKENVLPFAGKKGGRKEALRQLKVFIQDKLNEYLTKRSNPDDPKLTATSGLSPYLHFGFISVQEIVLEILKAHKLISSIPERLKNQKPGDRENFLTPNPTLNHFFDELLTWREIGYLFFWEKPEFRKNLSHLPDWVQKNFAKHGNDKRPFLYTREDWESAKTHDPLWNAAQIELVKTGSMHNYMRMLWGKKVIEWSASYEEAFDTLEHLNNKYAYDGRNPNSYTGILWCFGLFDRPWFPERPVLGNLRYMSSDSTKKKFKLNSYLSYVNSLQGKSDTLFSK